MAISVHITMKGSKTGAIKGSGKDGEIVGHAWQHEVVSPRDAASGLPTGRRQHKPITITKEIDRATPLIANALVTNELLTDVVLTVKGPNATGTVTSLFTIRLTNAQVASQRTEVLNTAFPGNEDLPPRESVSITYQKIEWTWVDGGITAMDDWEQQT